MVSFGERIPYGMLLILLISLTSMISSCLQERLSSQPPHIVSDKTVDVDGWTTQQLVEQGEMLLFGENGTPGFRGSAGKAQCPVCHAFQQSAPSTRAPSLWGITARKRTKPTSLDYLAKSHVCPSCYVVAGWQVKGSRGCESPMPRVHLPPIDLTIQELVAIDTWIYVHEGETPPEPRIIRKAYQNALSEKEWKYVTRDINQPLDKEFAVERVFYEHACVVCHTIPGITAATGKIGPILNMNTIIPLRLKDPSYSGNATSSREYIVESILHHDLFIIPEYAAHPNTTLDSSYYENKITSADLHLMVDYLELSKHDRSLDSSKDSAIEKCLHNLAS